MEKIRFPVYNRAFVKVDLDAIRSNFDALKVAVDPNALICSVVKANGYGHGALQVACALESRTDYFAVADLEEGIELREGGIKKPVLILGYTHPSQYELLFKHDITPAIFHSDDARTLSAVGQRLCKKLKIHVAVDTGMGRIGFLPDEDGAKAIKEISLLPGIELEGLFSHYAKADFADKTSANEQTERFDRLLSMLDEMNVKIPIKHICNSAGATEFDKSYDMVRLGIALYGLYPSDEVDKSKVSLKPAMSVFSHVIHVKTVEAGTGIGYGHAYVAPERRRIATVSIGYADGFNRCLTGRGWVLINGKRAPIRGKVCMDQIMVDVSGIDGVEVGDIAVILGKYGEEEITAELFGSLTDSFNYEVICTFMPRVKRIY